jgi:hypothetical protein
MTRIGITGHTDLSAATEELVRGAIRDFLATHEPAELTGVSCAAPGADTVFAETMVELGGRLEVVLPSRSYREQKVRPEQRPRFDEILGAATRIHVMPFVDSHREAYEAANEVLLDSSETLVAIWDGQAAQDRGGTAAVVERALARRTPVRVIWPEGAERTRRRG